MTSEERQQMIDEVFEPLADVNDACRALKVKKPTIYARVAQDPTLATRLFGGRIIRFTPHQLRRMRGGV